MVYFIDEDRFMAHTKHFFSCRWYLREGTTMRNHIAVISSSKGGIEIWKQVNNGNHALINDIYDTRKLNRKLRKFIMVT